MIQVGPGLYYRHFSTGEVLARIRARHVAEVSRHNAGVVEQFQLEHAPPRRDQVLREFDPMTRRMVR